MMKWLLIERVMEFESMTFSLARRRSTAELHPHWIVDKSYLYCFGFARGNFLLDE